jgi:diadenylate cyclase
VAVEEIVDILTTSAARLSDRKHGALIILQRYQNLQEFLSTGVRMDAVVTPELLLQIFYPNTPLHDGAAILSGDRVVAASCVMPLSASGSLLRTPERQMGLRHRAALGISEASDALALVVSEETGAISIASGGRMLGNLTGERLENILLAFYQPFKKRRWFASWRSNQSKELLQ